VHRIVYIIIIRIYMYMARHYTARYGTCAARQECVTGPGEVFYFPDSWHHATLNVADTIGIAFNHVPPPSRLSKLVTPRDYHWRIAPLDKLQTDASSSSSEEDTSAVEAVIRDADQYGANTDCSQQRATADTAGSGAAGGGSGAMVIDGVMSWFGSSGGGGGGDSNAAARGGAAAGAGAGGGADDLSAAATANKARAACMSAVVDAAVVELADYIWCAENTVGVVQPSALSPATIHTATTSGIPRLKALLGLEPVGMATTATAAAAGGDGDGDGDGGGGDEPAGLPLLVTSALARNAPAPEEGTLVRGAWARAAFVLGLALVGPGPNQDLANGAACLVAALDAGCERTARYNQPTNLAT
jgi:hypothetical protein